MVTRSMSKLAAAAGGLALVALAGAGIASADGLSEQAINTTCNYGQVHAALQAQSRALRAILDSHLRDGKFLQSYLASGPAARRAQAQNRPPGTLARPARRAVYPGDQPRCCYLPKLLTFAGDAVNLQPAGSPRHLR